MWYDVALVAALRVESKELAAEERRVQTAVGDGGKESVGQGEEGAVGVRAESAAM